MKRGVSFFFLFSQESGEKDSDEADEEEEEGEEEVEREYVADFDEDDLSDLEDGPGYAKRRRRDRETERKMKRG